MKTSLFTRDELFILNMDSLSKNDSSNVDW